MVNGSAQRMTFGTTERISLGKAAKRASAQPIGRAADRDFDWKSVQSPDHWREQQPADDDPLRGNGADFAAPAHAFEQPKPAAYPIAPRRATHGRTDVTPESGALTVQGVEKSFGNRMVVRGVSLTLRRGEAVGLLGPNGAGKTTVFYMITGLIKADKGAIQFDGHDITHLPMYQRARLGIGYLPQEASIFRGLNVEDNIRAVLEVVEPSKKKREQELEHLLEEFNIARLRKTPSIALSGGERRRTEIARALATRPAYMLLDEPFAGIDPIAVGDIQNLVQHLKERGIGVLITDHNVRETLGLTDRAYIIYSGEVLREGRADEIINDPEVRRLYLGEEFRM
jgi:lipopolysaccharide export system ATP-binding protein